MHRLTDISFIKDILTRNGFSFSKGLGQNFIINPDICPKIAEYGNARHGWGVLEIGTGIGVLTRELALRAEKVVAVEIDKRLMPILDETLSEFENVKIINQDIMKCDIAEIIREEFGNLKVAVCANLPYYITSPVIMKILESRVPVETVTVMVQKEAGDRICAKVGTREAGALTVAVNYYGSTERLFGVPRGNFMPSPKVDSEVIKIDVKESTPLDSESEKIFFRVVKSGFSQRRKTLANSLCSMMGVAKEQTAEILLSMGLPETSRIEQLNMENLIEFSEKLKNPKSESGE